MTYETLAGRLCCTDGLELPFTATCQMTLSLRRLVSQIWMLLMRHQCVLCCCQR